jgi:hypothetical protein
VPAKSQKLTTKKKSPIFVQDSYLKIGAFLPQWLTFQFFSGLRPEPRSSGSSPPCTPHRGAHRYPRDRKVMRPNPTPMINFQIFFGAPPRTHGQLTTCEWPPKAAIIRLRHTEYLLIWFLTTFIDSHEKKTRYMKTNRKKFITHNYYHTNNSTVHPFCSLRTKRCHSLSSSNITSQTTIL